MQYNVKWIINGSITITANSKEKAEEKIKNKDLDEIQNEANEIFNNMMKSKRITQME